MTNDGKRLFGTDPDSLRNSLGRMVQEAYNRSNCSLSDTYRTVRSWVDLDKRFDAYDRDRVVKALEEFGKSGKFLDLENDPYLRVNGVKRPLER